MSEQRPAAIDKRVLYNGCMEYLDCYIRDIVAIQKEVFVTLKNEFTYESVCEPTSSPKYLAVISKIASVTSSKEDLYKSLIKCYALWKDKLEPKVRDSTKKHTYAELPLRLAACFFLNGDYYKALMCLRHSIILESRNLLPRILALRWSAFLGEWEMAEMALAFEKAKETKTSQKGGIRSRDQIPALHY
ncbi:hypothetical protein KIN20_031220 [Parelaphostrongylus tenuis]|uniref:Uncharacterized protein n=1 Tax=Parelaphostrongylus tenuis TaxID=148309 RepID=A0AAD5R572_PARTN|nr:hypothetical protein KIN20_031220 [Parelaphostrongylus tenuis]